MTITYDQVEHFQGAQATKACAEDDYTDTANGRCRYYYERNKNPLTRTATLDPQAFAQVVGAQPSVVSAKGWLEWWISQKNSDHRQGYGEQLAAMQISAGTVTSIVAIYRP